MTEIDQIIEACTYRPPWRAARRRVEATRKPPTPVPPLVAGGQGREDWTPVETDRVGNFTHGMIVGCVIGAAMWVALAYAVWPTLVKIF